MKSFFGLLVVMLFCWQALAAEDQVVQRFRNSAIRAVEKAESRGMTEVEGIRLVDIKSVAKRIPIVYDPRIEIRQVGRRCAYWYSRIENATDISTGKKVTVDAHIRLNEECITLPDDELESLALHEVLGVGFGVDRNYEVSLIILTASVSSASMIEPNIQRQQAADFLVAGGGSVGVGGGGDSHDSRFKMEGLSYLKTFSTRQLYGIPIEFLELAIRKMRVSPATDLTRTVEFRAPGVEGPRAKGYVHSAIYRGNSADDKGSREFLAVVLARQMVLYASAELGLTKNSYIATTPVLTTESVLNPTLILPIDESNVVHWLNPTFSEKLSVQTRKELSLAELNMAMATQQSKHFKALIKFETSHLTLRLAP